MQALLREISACRHCEEALPLPPRPVVQAHPDARLLIVGQAPGLKVHNSGIPWDDASGDRLRDWLGMLPGCFYSDAVAIVPMGFCYPGRGKSGDLPPRQECAAKWHERLLGLLTKIELTLVVGAYAQKAYLGQSTSLTETVRTSLELLPDKIALPHPSPRNNIWLKKNPWFADEVLPALKTRIAELELDK